MKHLIKSWGFLFAISALFILGSCSKEDGSQQLEVDIQLIEKYIADHNLNANSTSTGLYYVVNNIGNGKPAKSNSQVLIRYKGYLLDGTVFDENWNPPLNFSLSGVIQGWKQGIPLFREGGKGTLLIPSSLGYGDKATGSIPANSVLIFDIELISVY